MLYLSEHGVAILVTAVLGTNLAVIFSSALWLIVHAVKACRGRTED